MREKARYNKLRIMKDKQGLWYVQEQRFGILWWTVFRTYSEEGVKSFINFSGLDYNTRTGLYE